MVIQLSLTKHASNSCGCLFIILLRNRAAVLICQELELSVLGHAKEKEESQVCHLLCNIDKGNANGPQDFNFILSVMKSKKFHLGRKREKECACGWVVQFRPGFSDNWITLFMYSD